MDVVSVDVGVERGDVEELIEDVLWGCLRSLVS